MNAWTLLPAATLRRIAAAALRMSVGVALLSSPADFGVAGAAPAAQAPPPGRLISGRVVEGAGPRPVGGAKVSLGAAGVSSLGLLRGRIAAGRLQDPPGLTSTIADAEGRFAIQSPTPGPVTIIASSGGYLAGAFGQMWPAGPEQALDPDRADKEVIVRLWKLATMQGRILFEDGSPARGVQIHAIAIGEAIATLNSPRAGEADTIVQTDAQGRYELSSLVPGKYVVGVAPQYATIPKPIVDDYTRQGGMRSEIGNTIRDSGGPLPNGSGTPVGGVLLQSPTGLKARATAADDLLLYQPAFYPDSPAPAGAATITLRLGETRAGIDLHLHARRPVRVGGTVVDPDGPVARLGVRLQYPRTFNVARSLHTAIAPAAAITDTQGRFQLWVTPGEYELDVLKKAPPPPAISTREHVGPPGAGIVQGMIKALPVDPDKPAPVLFANLHLSVDYPSVEGLAIALGTGARFSGRLEFTGRRARPAESVIGRSVVILDPILGYGLRTQIPVAPSGEYRSREIQPGRYVVSLANMGGWIVDSAVSGGLDVSKDSLDVGPGENDTTIRLSDQGATLVADIQRDGMSAPANPRIFVFPANVRDWRRPGVQQAGMRSDEVRSGRYTSPSLLPGDYYVVAVADAAFDFDWREPEMLEQLAAVAVRVSINPRETKSVSLPLSVFAR